MSDIQAGDVVVCINAEPIDFGIVIAAGGGLVRGRHYRVRYPFADVGIPCLMLHGDPLGQEDGRLALRFRKLNDGTDDAELIARIRKCKPVRQPEPAL